MDARNSHQKGKEGGAGKIERHEHKPEIMKLAVRQPERIQSLLTVLSDLEKISDVLVEDPSHDLGGAGGSVGKSLADSSPSPRDQMLAALPNSHILRRRLTVHLKKEVRKLERQSRTLAYSTKKGSAFLLNELYAKIRKIQELIWELVDAAEDTVKRLYVRLFVDRQELI